MKKQILLIMVSVFLLVIAPSVNAYMKLEMHFQKVDNNMVISILDFSEVPYSYPLDDYYNISENDSDVFKIQVLGTTDKLIYEKLVYVAFYAYDLGEINESYLLFTLPEIENPKTFKIIYQGVERFVFDIPSVLCNNNGICDGSENYLGCKDCKWYDKDGLCTGIADVTNLSLDYWEDNYCDLDCYKDDDCDKENCNDDIKNQDEIGVDTGGVCNLIYCNDGIKNGGEIGIDCGGSCPNQDCCTNGCQDENLGEEGVDCGGVCLNGCQEIVCGNEVCESGETPQNCPEDCVKERYLNVNIEPEEININKTGIYQIRTEIYCNGTCNNVRATLHYEEIVNQQELLSPEHSSKLSGFFSITFNFVLGLPKKITGFVVALVNPTGRTIVGSSLQEPIGSLTPNPQICGNMGYNTCILQWNVSANKEGSYVNYIIVESDEETIESDYININITIPPPPECIDTDPNQDIYLNGSCMDYDSYADYCNEDGGLMQFACENGKCNATVPYNCPQQYLCSGGSCIPKEETCINDCDYEGQQICSDEGGYKKCGNYDSDECLEWSNIIECSMKEICNAGECKREIRPLSCTDPDNNDPYYLRGNVTYAYIEGRTENTEVQTDSCFEGKLIEYYCEGNEMKNQDYTCPGACYNGACIYLCRDTDGGDNPEKKGTATDKYIEGGQIVSLPHIDACDSKGKQLVEYYCIDNEKGGIARKDYRCLSGCYDGACINPCNDTDGGNNQYVKGTVTYTEKGKKTKTYTDTCDSKGIKLKEYYCNEKNKVKSSNYKCENGCLDGACIKAEPECVDSDGGKNYHLKGETTEKEITFKDYCNQEGTLVEYYCNGDFAAMEHHNCQSGEICKDGTCIESCAEKGKTCGTLPGTQCCSGLECDKGICTPQ